MKWAGVDRDGTSRIKRQNRLQVSISFRADSEAAAFSLIISELNEIFFFMISDVTLNDCANNPRKVFSTRTKLDVLRDLGMNEMKFLIYQFYAYYSISFITLFILRKQ